MKGKYKRKKERHQTTEQVDPSRMNTRKEQKQSGEEKGQSKADNRKHDMSQFSKWWNDPAHVIQCVGIGVAIIVAVIYYFQLKSMQDSVNTARKISERESRAMAKLHRTSSNVEILPDRILQIPARVDNVGKTPAKRVVAVAYIELVPKDNSPNMSSTDILPLYRTEIGDMFPGDHAEFNMRRMKAKGAVQKGGETEISPLSDVELASITNGDVYIATHGQVAYDDVFHVRHWTNFCFWYESQNIKRYKTADCLRYNTEDDEDEP